ncbi:MAG: glutathione S-transferase N-terminal domain-containing protein [Oleispira sp.]|jgi:glutaredoxin|nr:glutathione S-transferase N-terminal domain-containing protein [Oleispira sp.]
MSVKHRLQGFCLTFAYHCFKAKPVKRSNKEQCSLDRESRRIQLYFCKTCPASIKIKRHCEQLGLRVVEKDVQRVNAYRNELIHGGGEVRVPCLRIEGRQGKETRWLYSGDVITQYLDRRFAA